MPKGTTLTGNNNDFAQNYLRKNKRQKGGNDRKWKQNCRLHFRSKTRMNPPTKGHGKLIGAVSRIAEERGGSPFVFVSTSHDARKNPLSYTDKVAFLQTLFPDANVVHNPSIKNPFHATGYLSDQGFTDLIFVVGSDRVEEFKTRFNRAEDYFNSFEIVSAGSRDPESGGLEGMSGTKAREAAKVGDKGKFRAATGWSGAIATEMMKVVKKGMGE